MKKIISIMITFLLILTLVSCSKSYKVLEINGDGNDSLSEVNHKTEVELNTKEYEKIFTSSKKKITVNNVDYEVAYKNSIDGYLYNNRLDYYENTIGSTYIRVGINNDSGIIDSYSWFDQKYVDKINTVELSKDECLKIAKEYLSQYISDSEYSLIEGRYLSMPEFKAIYLFEFVRMIDGIKTSDAAHIEVSVFGDVVGHLFTSLGEMKDAKLPSDEDMETIEKNVEAKIKSIYQNVYEYSYEIEDIIFMRLKDGKYALEYRVDVKLKPTEASMEITECTSLLVYVN